MSALLEQVCRYSSLPPSLPPSPYLLLLYQRMQILHRLRLERQQFRGHFFLPPSLPPPPHLRHTIRTAVFYPTRPSLPPSLPPSAYLLLLHQRMQILHCLRLEMQQLRSCLFLQPPSSESSHVVVQLGPAVPFHTGGLGKEGREGGREGREG